MPHAPLVLLAEDNPLGAAFLKDLLGELGCRVHAVADGGEALSAVQERPYDAVVSDCDMPVLKGPELYAEACRLRPELRERFVFVTGNPKLLPEGLPCPVLAKAFHIEQFFEAVRGVLKAPERPMQEG